MSNGLETLSVADVLRIHDVLVRDFADTGDPIGAMGIRSAPLLESAVGRQQTGHGVTLKYPDPLANAATLAYGICCDHPFINGNKRTALVAMLVHLDKNRLCVHRTKESDLYQLMLSIADHSIGLRIDPRHIDKARTRRSSDEEVAAIRDWLRKRTEKITRGERPVTFRQLGQLLARFDISLENPHSNTIDVVRTEVHKPIFLVRRQPKVVKKRLGSIGYRDEGTQVSFPDLKRLREMCKLREQDGVDSDAFYADADVIDAFVNKYRTVLRRLART